MWPCRVPDAAQCPSPPQFKAELLSKSKYISPLPPHTRLVSWRRKSVSLKGVTTRLVSLSISCRAATVSKSSIQTSEFTFLGEQLNLLYEITARELLLQAQLQYMSFSRKTVVSRSLRSKACGSSHVHSWCMTLQVFSQFLAEGHMQKGGSRLSAQF